MRLGKKMPKNSKNSKRDPRDNLFELLSESNDDELITVETTSARGRPLKRTQPFEPNSPPERSRRTRPRRRYPSQHQQYQVPMSGYKFETSLRAWRLPLPVQNSGRRRRRSASRLWRSSYETSFSLGLAQLPWPIPLHHHRLLRPHRHPSLLGRFQVLDST